MNVRISLIAGVALVAGPAWAQQAPAAAPAAPASAPAPSGVQFAQSSSDRDNFTGDRIKYAVTLSARATRLGNGGETVLTCVPAGTSMYGLGKGTLVDGTSSKDRSLFTVREAPVDAGQECRKEDLVKRGQTVLLDPEMLQKSPPDRYGWTFGTLVVPYKYQIKGDRSLSGGATLGGYMGYRATVYGTSAVGIVFAGATKVDVPVEKDGKAATESVAGLSYGVGLLGSIKDAFKVGLVVGADRVDRKVAYVNNGRAWVSISLGYDFYN